MIPLWRLGFLDLVLRKRRSSDGCTLPERRTSGVAPRNRSDAVGQSPHFLLESCRLGGLLVSCRPCCGTCLLVRAASCLQSLDLASAWRLAHLERRTFVRETAHRGLPLVARRRFAGLPLSQARLVAWVARVAQNIFTVHVHRHTLSRSLFQWFSFQTDM